MELIDSHAHLTTKEMLVDIDQVMQRALDAGIKNIINICTDQNTLLEGIKLAKRYPRVYNVGATTPHDVEELGEKDFSFFAQKAKEKKIVAIGETGLDYYYEHSNRDKQKSFLTKYLRLAKKYNLPVVIHCREAFADFFTLADQESISSLVLHCFTGSLLEAKEVIQRGWMLSLSGIVTFKKSDALREVVKIVPLDQLLIETDCPFLAPGTFRGKRNEPAYLLETLRCISQIKGVSEEYLAKQTANNAEKFFRIGSSKLA